MTLQKWWNRYSFLETEQTGLWVLTLLCLGSRRRLQRGGGSSPHCQAGWCRLHVPPGKSPCRHCRLCRPAREREREREKGSKATVIRRDCDLPCVTMFMCVHANNLHGKSIALHLIDCHVFPELLGNFGSWRVPKMPPHSRGAWNTT